MEVTKPPSETDAPAAQNENRGASQADAELGKDFDSMALNFIGKSKHRVTNKHGERVFVVGTLGEEDHVAS